MKVKVALSTGFAIGEHKGVIEVPDEWLEGKTEEQRDEVIQQQVNEWAWEHIDLSWEVQEESQ